MASDAPSPLDYAAPITATAGGAEIDIKEAADAVRIIIPPRSFWGAVLPRALLLLSATALLVFSLWQVSLNWSQNKLDGYSGVGMFLLGAVVISAVAGLVRSARIAKLQTVLEVSSTALTIDEPSHDPQHARARRWPADRIAYVYVQRTALVGPDVRVSILVIRPGSGSMEHVCSFHTRAPDLNRRLELLINRHLRGCGAGAAMPVIPAAIPTTDPDDAQPHPH